MTRPTLDIDAGTALPESDGSARRTRLREFQAKLVERMQAASSGAVSQASQLGVMIGQTRWLLNLQQAGEIVPVGSIAKVPLTQAWFLGLTNIRGNLTSVIDLAHFCGQPLTPIDKESRVIAFALGLAFNSGLFVSRVMGLRNPAEMEVYSSAETHDAPWAIRRYLDRDSQVWTELDLSLIVQDPQFLHVGL